LKEGEADERQQRVVVQPRPRAALEVVEAQLLFELLVRLLNGLIANDKFCLTRTARLSLSWSRRVPRRAPSHAALAARQGTTPLPGGSDATPARSAAAAPDVAGGPGRAAAVGPGVPAPARRGRGAHAAVSDDPRGGGAR